MLKARCQLNQQEYSLLMYSWSFTSSFLLTISLERMQSSAKPKTSVFELLPMVLSLIYNRLRGVTNAVPRETVFYDRAKENCLLLHKNDYDDDTETHEPAVSYLFLGKGYINRRLDSQIGSIVRRFVWKCLRTVVLGFRHVWVVCVCQESSDYRAVWLTTNNPIPLRITLERPHNIFKNVLTSGQISSQFKKSYQTKSNL